MACCFAAFGLVLSAPALLFGFVAPDPFEFTLLASLGLVAGLSIHLHAQAFQLAPASVLAPVDYLGVLLSVGIGFVVWDETPSYFMLAGGVLIIGAGLLQFRKPA